MANTINTAPTPAHGPARCGAGVDTGAEAGAGGGGGAEAEAGLSTTGVCVFFAAAGAGDASVAFFATGLRFALVVFWGVRVIVLRSFEVFARGFSILSFYTPNTSAINDASWGAAATAIRSHGRSSIFAATAGLRQKAVTA